MARVDWDGAASLMRVTQFRAADPQEELIVHGPLATLIVQALALPAAEQDGLLIRQTGPDWVEEHDADAIRELAARPEFTGAAGDYDTAGLPEDPDRAEVADGPIISGGVSGADEADMRGQDGEK